MASAAFEDIADTFDFLDDWEDRYRHVIDMGKAMPALDEAERVAMAKVDGCASQVWLVPTVTGQGPDAVVTLRGESDAMIVRGLIAVLIALYSDQSAKAIMAIDASKELERLGLNEHLSAQRSNGVRAMVERVRLIAQAAMTAV